jgi:hypothetical protein
MASINASGEAAMRLAMCSGNLTSIRTVEKVAANLGEETNRCIRVSIQWRRHPLADRGRGSSGKIGRARNVATRSFQRRCCNVAIGFRFRSILCTAGRQRARWGAKKARLSQKAPIYLVDSHY